MSAEPGNTQQNRLRVQIFQGLNRHKASVPRRWPWRRWPSYCSCCSCCCWLLEKLCCRYRTSLVVVAPTTISFPCWTKHVRCRFFVFKICRILSSEPGDTRQNRVRVQRVEGFNWPAERAATLTLASYVLLPLPQLLFCCCWRSSAVDAVH